MHLYISKRFLIALDIGGGGARFDPEVDHFGVLVNVDGLDLALEEAEQNVFAQSVETNAFRGGDVRFRGIGERLIVGLDLEVRPTGHDGRAEQEPAAFRDLGEMIEAGRSVSVEVRRADAPDAELAPSSRQSTQFGSTRKNRSELTGSISSRATR